MSGANSLLWACWGCCLLVSFVLSGLEAGLFALQRARLQHQARRGRSSAQLLLRFLNQPEQLLWTLFLGNTLMNFTILVWVLMVLETFVGERPVLFWGGYGAAVFAFYTLFDLLPKTLFRLYPHRMSNAVVGPVRVVHRLFRPVVWLIERGAGVLLGWKREPVMTGQWFGNREELRVIMQESVRGITTEEHQLINRVLDLHNVTVRLVMKPMAMTVTLTMDTPLRAAMILCREKGRTRFPVWDASDGVRRVAGLLDMSTLIYRDDLELEGSIARFVRPTVFLDAELPVEKAVQRMRRSGQHLAIVVGSDQRELGILTLHDALTRMFGEGEF